MELSPGVTELSIGDHVVSAGSLHVAPAKSATSCPTSARPTCPISGPVSCRTALAEWSCVRTRSSTLRRSRPGRRTRSSGLRCAKCPTSLKSALIGCGVTTGSVPCSTRRRSPLEPVAIFGGEVGLSTVMGAVLAGASRRGGRSPSRQGRHAAVSVRPTSSSRTISPTPCRRSVKPRTGER